MFLGENLFLKSCLFPGYLFHHVTAGEVNSWHIPLEALQDLVLGVFKKLKFK